MGVGESWGWGEGKGLVRAEYLSPTLAMLALSLSSLFSSPRLLFSSSPLLVSSKRDVVHERDDLGATSARLYRSVDGVEPSIGLSHLPTRGHLLWGALDILLLLGCARCGVKPVTG